MNMEWLPISPYLTPNGAFHAFRGHSKAAELKPVELGPGEEPFVNFWAKEVGMKAWQSMELGIGNVASFAESLRVTKVVFDAMYYREKTLAEPDGGYIVGTRWGAGFRLMVTVTEFNCKVGIDLRSVAVSTELGLCRSSFEITGYGLGNPALLALFPLPGRFDGATLGKIQAAAVALRDRYSKDAREDHRDELEAVPMQVLLQEPLYADPMEVARVRIAIARMVANRTAMKDAIAAAARWGMPEKLVLEVYSRFAAEPEPSRPAARRARDWLDV